MTQLQVNRGTIPEWDIADRLSKALRHADIGVQTMAIAMGVSRETIGRWINGRGRPPARAAVIAFASLTGVDLEWLETGQAPTSETSRPVAALPRLDSNQQPSGYVSSLVRRVVGRILAAPLPDPCPHCGYRWGHLWRCPNRRPKGATPTSYGPAALYGPVDELAARRARRAS